MVPLLATKLHRPQLPPHILRRQRLLDELEKGGELPLVLVSAPAGYGKSTLVAEWLEGAGRPVAWLSLDRGDSELQIFLSYVVTAIESLLPEACAVTKSALRSLCRESRLYFKSLMQIHLRKQYVTKIRGDFLQCLR